MENSLVKVTDVKKFGRLFLEKYSLPATYWERDVEKACECKNWRIAKIIAIVRYWCRITRGGTQLITQDQKNFWSDLKTDFEQTVNQYEIKNALTWAKLLYQELKVTKNAYVTVREVQKVLKLLIDNSELTLNETFSRVKIFFMAFDIGAQFVEPKTRIYIKKSRSVLEYTESLEYYVATSKSISKSDRLQILEFIEARGLFTLKPSGENNLPTPLELAKRKNVMALRFFLSHPDIHNVTDAEGRNLMHYLALHYPVLPYLNNFKLDQLKNMLKVAAPVYNKLKKITPMDVLRMSVSRGCYPSIYFRAIRELILEGEIKDCEFFNAATFHLGFLGKYFFADLGINNKDIEDVMKNYAKTNRKNKEKELISSGDTTFAFDALPVEIAHLIFSELDYQSHRSLLSVSKSIADLKSKFSDAMYDVMLRKEFPMNANYIVKGKKGYFDIARRYSNWKKGTFNVRYIEWSKTRPRKEPRFFTMDENWLSFRTDRDFKVWDCHNDQIYDLPNLNIDAVTSITFLESHPGEVPITACFSLDAFSIVVNGRSAQKAIKHAAVAGHGGFFVEAIDNDRVFMGGPGRVWSIEKETIIGQLNIEGYHMNVGQFNPHNNLIFTNMVLDLKSVVAVYDKHLQKVTSIPSDIMPDFFRFVDDHNVVLRNSNNSSIWDLRKTDQPHKFVDLSIENASCSRYGLTTYPEQRLAVVWDLKTGQWENTIILPDNVRYQSIGNSRYACWQTFGPTFCVVDFQS